MKRRPPPRKPGPADPVWLYGRHAVLAALNNPARHQHKLLATKNALDWLAEHDRPIDLPPVQPTEIDRALAKDAVHQGLAMLASPLPPRSLESAIEAAGSKPFLLLDQVTDPQNIGALFRIAAAFGAAGIVAQDRRTPPLSGALTKAAAGTAEFLPFISVVNISNALEQLKQHSYVTLGMAGETGEPLQAAAAQTMPFALVVGAEGKGLRQRVRETCDMLVRIPMDSRVESLNVATAAGIALYALTSS